MKIEIESVENGSTKYVDNIDKLVIIPAGYNTILQFDDKQVVVKTEELKKALAVL